VTLGNGRKGKRFVHYAAEQKSQCLIYTSAFHDVLQQGQGAGFAFEFRGTYEYTDAIREHLEERGPKGVLHNQSNERAHLRAILAALTWKSWEDEGWKGIVIATNCPRLPNDSSFNYWIYSDWQARVTNGDLWEAISDEITSLKGRGVAVFFWKVSDEECQFVQEAAKLGAKMRTPPYYRTLTANLPTELNV
jgi:ribonuclease HI